MNEYKKEALYCSLCDTGQKTKMYFIPLGTEGGKHGTKCLNQIRGILVGICVVVAGSGRE